MANYIQLSIDADAAQQDLFIAGLSELGASGFEQTDTHLLAYFSESDFPSYEVNALLKPASFTIQTLPEQNWNEVWESNFQPVVVDEFCGVRAHFHQPLTGVAHEIVITPKMSFGTGHHATTHMMMQQMRPLDFRGKTVFDFGTGTGILAILAEKLGAGAVTAIDNDEWSIENAKENVLQNGCSNITLQLADAIPAGPFDVILANINRNVILAHLGKLSAALAPNGMILFSGLLQEDGAVILEACSNCNLVLQHQQERDKWISLLMLVR